MTNRERLIEILKLGSCPSPYICDESCKYANLKQCYEERTADLLLEHGVIVPPCKVGTIVWILRKDRVPDDDYRMNFHDEWVICEVSFQLSMINQIGKTVFLTREEAEKALKERESNGEVISETV